MVYLQCIGIFTVLSLLLAVSAVVHDVDGCFSSLRISFFLFFFFLKNYTSVGLPI